MMWWRRLRELESSWRSDVMWRGQVWSVIATIALMIVAVLLLALLQWITRGEVRWS